MEPNEMFRISCNAAKEYDWNASCGLPKRIYAALWRSSSVAGYKGNDDDYVNEQGELCPENIRRDVLNGRIWYVRNIGEWAVKTLCEWLASQEHDPQP